MARVEHAHTQLTLYAIMTPLGLAGGSQLKRILTTVSFTAMILCGGLDAVIEVRVS